MKNFQKEFLNEDWEDLPDAPRVFVAAFGKHPGWNDHMDDIGLLTESLVEAKRCAYIQGISSQIESGAWEKLGPEKALAGFDHVFIWHRPSESIAGFISSSKDGKGRSLYPMVLCAHVIAQPIDWIWSEVFPRLDAARMLCQKATTPKAVVVAINMAQEALRRRAGSGRVRLSDTVINSRSLLGTGKWTAHFARESSALLRVCHHLAVNMKALDSNDGSGGPSARGLRLPSIPKMTPIESLNAWLCFLGGQMDPFWPVLLIERLGGNWVDAVIGEPTKDDFFRLRAGPAADPIISNIPYSVSPEFERLMSGVLSNVNAGRMPAASILSGKSDGESLSAATQRLRDLRRSGAKRFLSKFLYRE